jgi:uncharacterized membrane protein
MSRPKLPLKANAFDTLLEILACVTVLYMFFFLAISYTSLPARIPSHYNAAGAVDGWGSKSMLLTLAIIGTVLYAGVTFLQRLPHIFNYPFVITYKNAHAQYLNAVRMMRFLKTIIAIQFAYIVHSSIEVAKGNQEGLGGFFLPTSIILIFGSLTYFIVQAFKSR